MPIDPLVLQPGDLRHKVTIQQANLSERDAAGQPIATAWTTILTTRAKIENTGGVAYKMSFGANALASDSSNMLTIRWPGRSITIEPGQRVIFGDNTYRIEAVDNVLQRNRVVRLACKVVDQDSN